ncbi:MAG: hypothetical protein HFH90_11095 [Lachnospiraceae bacterium]|jgi:hypothetical protein|nr:hypothetical protein [Lachnospiraceae bacterium]
MASDFTSLAAAAEEEKKKLKEEKKRFKQEQKSQKKEAKRRAAEIAKQEEALGEDGGNGLVTVLATILIVVLWLAVIGVVIKMDVGGFGSSVLTPILKDVPVLNKILPTHSAGTVDPDVSGEGYGGYSSIEEAVETIRKLELEIDRLQTSVNAKDADIEKLKAEVQRLSEFEKMQVEFQRIMTEYYEEVVYSDKGPGPEEYRKYYEGMNPAVAEYLYKQVIVQEQEDTKFQEHAQTFAAMKPKEAASTLEKMADVNAVAKILNALSVEDRAKILNVMDKDTAAKVVKIMDPQS